MQRSLLRKGRVQPLYMVISVGDRPELEIGIYLICYPVAA